MKCDDDVRETLALPTSAVIQPRRDRMTQLLQHMHLHP
jgi:hypothetical protein